MKREFTKDEPKLMNLLIGAAVLLLGASAVALVSGWGTAEETLIWTSIGASIAAGVVLAVAYVKSRRTPASVPSYASRLAQPEAATEPELEVATEPVEAPAEPAAAEPTEEPIAEAPAPVARSTRSPSRPRTPSRAKPTAAKSSAKKPSPTKASEVVAIPDRKKFHRPDCRFAQAKGAEKMTKAVARRRNYEACGICKP